MRTLLERTHEWILTDEEKDKLGIAQDLITPPGLPPRRRDAVVTILCEAHLRTQRDYIPQPRQKPEGRYLMAEEKERLGIPQGRDAFLSVFGDHEYIGTAEDMDALGIPRSHTVISPGFAHKSKPSPKRKTKVQE